MKDDQFDITFDDEDIEKNFSIDIEKAKRTSLIIDEKKIHSLKIPSHLDKIILTFIENSIFYGSLSAQSFLCVIYLIQFADTLEKKLYVFFLLMINAFTLMGVKNGSEVLYVDLFVKEYGKSIGYTKTAFSKKLEKITTFIKKYFLLIIIFALNTTLLVVALPEFFRTFR